jgi:hypothetical protein
MPSTLMSPIRARWLMGLAVVLASMAGAGAARADEVAPEIDLTFHALIVSKSSTGSEAFSCLILVWDQSGTFECGDQVTGQVVGVTSGSSDNVVGHRIRFTRTLLVNRRAARESYVGSIDVADPDDDRDYWIAGEFTTNVPPPLVPFPPLQPRGPFPFTGTTFLVVDGLRGPEEPEHAPALIPRR